MKLVFGYIGIAFLIFSCTSEPSLDEKETITHSSTPQKTILSQLPDSLRVKPVSLADFPPPRIVPIPKSGVNQYRYQNQDGEWVELEVSAPKSQPLLILKDPNDQAVQSAEGDNFILGEGGISQFITFTTDQGLALDGVNSVLLDRRGHMWFGTNGGGVSRYDGNSFTTFTTTQGLVGNTIRSMWEDQKGNIWIGTLTGLSKFDGYAFQNFTLENGLPNDVIFGITEDQAGNLWLGTGGGGVLRFDGEEFRQFTTKDGLADDFVMAVGQDSLGNLYFGTNGAGMSRFDGKSFFTYTEVDGLAGNRVRSFGTSNNGTLWIGTIGNGVSRFDGKSFENYTQKDGLADNIVRAIQVDKSGQVWFGTEHGISRFDGKKFVSYTREQGLSANSVLDIGIDQSGKVWFGTDGGGVSRFDGNSFTSFTMNQGLGANIILSTLEDRNGNLWFGTSGGGVSRFDGRDFTTFSLNQGLSGDIVYAMTEDQEGNIWLGTGGGGLSKFDGERFAIYTSDQGLISNEIYSIIQDAKGKLWLGTENGVNILDGNLISYLGPDQGLAGTVVLSMQAEPDGSVWIASVDGGLSYFDGESIRNFTTEQGLIDNAVIQIELDRKGNLWIGTEHGLSYLSKESKKKLLAGERMDEGPFENFSTSNGLPDNVVLQITELNSEKIALGTNLGIAIFDGPKDENGKLKALENMEIFNSNSGYPVKDLTDGQNGMFVDKQGILWAGTGSNKTALVRFDYEARLRNTEKPDLFLRQLRINEEVLPWSVFLPNSNPAIQVFEETAFLGRNLTQEEKERIRERFNGLELDGISGFFPIPEKLILPYRHNHVNIDFGTNEISKPFLVEYQYILEGYDEEWSPILKKTSATFGNILEGEYTFLVKARFSGPSEGEAGEWTEPIAFSFTVLPPWYRTWWAYLFYSLAFLSLIYPVHRYQRNQTIKKEQEKARERELQQAREIEKAYSKLEIAHENLKSTQAQLIQQEKLASLGQLTAGIAHEIKNPLNFVNNFSGLSLEFMDEIDQEIEKMPESEALENIKDLLADIKTNLTKIKHHGGRADGIVKSMLMHSRGSTGNMEPTDLNSLIEEYVNLSFHGMRANKNPINVEIALDLEANLPKVPINSEDFSRVVLNLSKNAFDAMRDKLQKDGSAYKPKLSIKTVEKDHSIQLIFEDNGPGVPAEIKDKLLLPFFTTKKGTEGTGLGLSITHDIIKAHSGSLEIDTQVGQWTRFTITLPKTNTPQTP